MAKLRHLLVIGGLALGAGALARAYRPRLAEIRRSFRTSSSPGAAAYDVLAGLFLGGYYDDIAADCAVTLAGVGAPSILEVGPGPGHLAGRLLALLPDARWTGLDIDPSMLSVAGRRLADEGLGDRSHAAVGDVAAMPFESTSFDLVVSSLSAHHWPDAAAGFREIHRVLRPGAVALVFDLPETFGHAETGFLGIGAASSAFDRSVVSRMRGLGPWTLVRRVELRRPEAGSPG
ncbi:MAG: class I SAM-dependent methyltransferase [Chloroflexota bacterium]|nr:class I SAM-dependent methyltransferase [Chloroflexota bacterium]